MIYLIDNTENEKGIDISNNNFELLKRYYK